MGLASRGGMLATFLGILAVLLWGSTIAVMRAVVEQLGAMGAGALANLLGGGLALLAVVIRRGGLRRLLGLPRPYLAGCGLLFVAYCPPLYLAVEWAESREQTVQVALINYLWPAMTLALSVPLLRKKARWSLGPGMLLALGGVYLATVGNGAITWGAFRDSLAAHPLPCLMAFVAASVWAFYSVLSRRWADGAEETGVPLFLVATGLVLAAFWWNQGAPVRHAWTARGALELLYLAIFPTLLAYWCWDAAMRKGNVVLVTSLSFFIPLVSTVMSCLYLGVAMGARLWLAAALLVAGAVLCKLSIREADAGSPS